MQTTEVPVYRRNGTLSAVERDVLAVEEPLEIRLAFDTEAGYVRRSISITMRTPGRDAELALGFLHGEGLVRHADQVHDVVASGPPGRGVRGQNVVTIRLKPGVQVDLDRLKRHFYTTSSCGVCGKRSLEALETVGAAAPPAGRPVLDPDVVHRLPDRLRQRQELFRCTGGLHAAALFDTAGRIVQVREDVGRHNALDKLVGWCLREGRLPAHDAVLLLSGRASFELLQKAVMAGIPVVAAVGAPSSLAVDLAERFGLTLLGFVRDHRFNIYAGRERLSD